MPKENKLVFKGNTYHIRKNYKVMGFIKVGVMRVETRVVF